MKQGYRELVGLQATFSDIASVYSIEHYYRWSKNGELSPTLTMRTYDMMLTISKDAVLDGLRNAFAPAILSIWQQVKPGSNSEYLQFQVGGTPDELNLDGDWTLWAEW